LKNKRVSSIERCVKTKSQSAFDFRYSTVSIVVAMKEYNPDSTWSEVKE
jgi:hypothetical protein